MTHILVPATKPPGGTSLAARQHMVLYPDLVCFWVKGLAVLVEPSGDAGLWLDLCFSMSFYMSLLVEKQGLGLRRRSSVGLH